MIQLLFQPGRLPRTMTREEWREVWRWKRLTQKRLNQEAEFIQSRLADVAIFGRSEILESFIRPPIMVYPDIEPLADVDLRPGAISYR